MTTSTVTIYHNPRCSKSRQTLQLLEDQGITPIIIDYMDEPPNKETLQGLVALLGLPVRDLLRTTEQVFKDAGLDENDLTDDDIYEALCECPSLLQRPIVIVDDSRAALGRPPESVLEIL